MSDRYPQDFESSLDVGSERFLSKVIQHSLAEDWCTPADFVRHFPPAAMMEALAGADALRSEVLVKAANVHEKLAAKKSIESASEDLQLALEEGLTTPAKLVELFGADDQVRYLSATDLWSLAFEEPFWEATSGSERDDGVERMEFIIECGLDEGLLSLQDLADALTFEELAKCLPKEQLEEVVVHAFKQGRDGKPLDESGFLEVVPLRRLLEFNDLDVVWKQAISDRLAEPLGFVSGIEGAAPAAKKEAAPAVEVQADEGDWEAADASGADDSDDSSVDISEKVEDSSDESPEPARSAPPPKPGRVTSSAPPKRPSQPVALGEGDAEPADTTEEDAARLKAIAKLREVERLPPSFEDLSTPILLSIESMYAELLTVDDDEEREACIEDSFPNEQHLKTAMLALIELLDTSINVHKPPISDAEPDALVKVVAFEERQRHDKAQQRRSSVRPPPIPRGGPLSR